MSSIEDLLKKQPTTTNPLFKSAQQKMDEKMQAIKLKALEDRTELRANELGLGYINLVGTPIPPEAIELIPKPQAIEHKTVCFFYDGTKARIATTNPENPVVEEIRFQVAERAHAEVKTYLISENSLAQGLKVYETLPEIKEIVKGVQITEDDLDRLRTLAPNLTELAVAVKGVNTTDFVGLIIAVSLSSGVSDIHIEAQEKTVDVKYRIDGVLHKVADVDKSRWGQIISRIKLFSALKINKTNVPQDGRFTIFTSEGKVDVRVSTIPSAYGESVVMRLLKPGSIKLKFDDLGVRGKAWEQLKAQIARPNGMIVTTGPTGSGKTTTLYSILNRLNDGETKIITLEDPVEYKLEGIVQSQIDKSKEYTFAKGLNSILRQDPDVVMVGELRDLETAEIAIQAALTGHLVVSTIHTNSAAGAVPRFLSMGVKPFLLAPALNAIIGQRLVRRICNDCKEEQKDIAPEKLERVRAILGKLSPESGYTPDLNNLKFYHGRGCATCNGIGLKGRVGIYEIFAMTEQIEKVILSGQVSEYDMERIAGEQGMISMVQDGLLKALDGLTTIDEVFEVAE